MESETTLLNIVNTLADLKARMPFPGTHVLLISKEAPGDNKGGFYRWDMDAAGEEDTTYMNTVISDHSETGRWIRVFQSARTYPHGIMVLNGGVKSFWVAGLSDSNGLLTVYLTEDGTPTGAPLFQEIWSSQCEATVNMQSANDAVVITRKSTSQDLKVLTYRLAKGNQTNLGMNLGAILGAGISSMANAPAGIPCQLRIDGV